jgi:tetratricopeptide (TPR) repeat protein
MNNNLQICALFMISFIASPLCAQSLEQGLYISDQCGVMIGIENPYRDSFNYYLHDATHNTNYQTLIVNGEQLEFEGLSVSGCSDNDHTDTTCGDKGFIGEASMLSSDAFRIQNRSQGDEPSYIFEGCAELLEFTRVSSATHMLNRLQKSEYRIENTGKYFWFNFYKKYFGPIVNEEEVSNNMAYYLYQTGQYAEAEALLWQIVDRLPDRTVAHLNYADVLNKLGRTYQGEKGRDKLHYLTYLSQMLYDNKRKRIPNELKSLYTHYFPLLEMLNRSVGEKYVVIAEAVGDLNRDGKDDISIVVELADRNKIEDVGNRGDRFPDHNQRLWFVFLGEVGGYSQIGMNDSLLLPDEDPACDDPLGVVSMSNNSLYLHTGYWCSMGSWRQGSVKYQFIYRNNQLLLAGKEEMHDNRASGEGEYISTNYLTGRQKIQKFIDHGSPVGQPVWSTLEDSTAVTFKDLTN